MSKKMMSVLLAGVFGAWFGWGCNEHPLEGVEPEHWFIDPRTEVEFDLRREIDVLLVVDNSGSMALAQVRVARGIESLVSRLDEMGADYRIGVTTTDNGHLWMPGCAGKKAHAGALRVDTCRSRIDGLATEDAAMFDRACAEVCAHQTLEFLPTRIAAEGEARPRPWIERTAGVANLADGVSPAQALQCIVMQGVGGCGFESHLESMFKSILRSRSASDDAFGFLRPGASLVILFVTDEDDCSARQTPAFADAWDLQGSSAQCWAYGVRCEEGPEVGVYTTCSPADVGVDGELTEPEEAVLQPLSRYVDLLEEFQGTRSRSTMPHEPGLLVGIIGGVPTDVREGADIPYVDDVDDPQFQEEYGIGPGCESEVVKAVPPVRLRDLAAAFPVRDRPELHSICSEDHARTFEAIADTVETFFDPWCTAVCLEDRDSSTPRLDACSFELVHIEASGQRTSTPVPACEIDEMGASVVPDGAELCHDLRTGDELSARCREAQARVQVHLVPRPGGFVRGDVLRGRCDIDRYGPCNLD